VSSAGNYAPHSQPAYTAQPASYPPHNEPAYPSQAQDWAYPHAQPEYPPHSTATPSYPPHTGTATPSYPPHTATTTPSYPPHTATTTPNYPPHTATTTPNNNNNSLLGIHPGMYNQTQYANLPPLNSDKYSQQPQQPQQRSQNEDRYNPPPSQSYRNTSTYSHPTTPYSQSDKHFIGNQYPQPHYANHHQLDRSQYQPADTSQYSLNQSQREGKAHLTGSYETNQYYRNSSFTQPPQQAVNNYGAPVSSRSSSRLPSQYSAPGEAAPVRNKDMMTEL